MPLQDGFSREQMQLVCWEGLIEKDNAVRVIDALVNSLDINQLGFETTGEANTGRPAYDVSDLLKLCLYGYSGTSDHRSIIIPTHATRDPGLMKTCLPEAGEPECCAKPNCF